jgi:hypothetical protein
MTDLARVLVSAAACLAVLASRPALAQDEARDRARALSEQGQALYEEGKYGEAAAKFAEAQAAFAHPNNLFNLAKAWEKAAEYQKAIDAYREFLDFYERQNGKAAPEAADVERTIVVLKDKAFLAMPEVTIDSDPTGADIMVDDATKVLGQTPFVTHLPEGGHKVFLRKGGYQGFEKEFAVRSREPLRLTFALEKTRNEGGLKFQVNVRGARIHVDGKVVAATPFYETLPVEAGRHQVLIEKDRYTEVTRTVDVATGQTSEVAASLHVKSKEFSWRGYVGITSAVLGAATVAVAGTVLRGRANDEYTGTPTFEDFKKWTYVGYGVGSALVGIGVGLFIWEFARTDVYAEDLAEEPARSIPVVTGGVDGDGRAWVGATARF